MPRTARPRSTTGWYHLMNRGADRQDIFSTDRDFLRFESILADSASVTSVEVHAYCLMTNHFHLLVRDPADRVAHLMRRLTGAYSLRYNLSTGRTGPLFGGRYTSVPIERNPQLPTVGRYIHRNPLALAPLDALATYRWSSFGVYCGLRSSPTWLRTDHLLDATTPAAYRTFVETTLPHDRDHQRSTRPKPSLDELDAAVARRFASGAVGATRQKTDSRARTMAVMLAVELRVALAADLAVRYGYASGDVVRATARRGRILVTNEPSFGRARSAILEALAASGVCGACPPVNG